MELRDDETIIFDGHPSPRATLALYGKGAAIAIAIGVILWFTVSSGVGIGAALVIAVLTIVVGAVARRRVRYVITTQRLYIREGILSKYEQQTRVARIQDVSTRQSFFERMLGIGTVDFDTASNEADDEFAFHGVSDPGEVVRAVDEAQRSTGAGATATAAPGGDL